MTPTRARWRLSTPREEARPTDTNLTEGTPVWDAGSDMVAGTGGAAAEEGAAPGASEAAATGAAEGADCAAAFMGGV